MDGTTGAIEFMQRYYNTGGVQSDQPDNSARIAVTTETDWTEDAATRDASLAFFVTQDGELMQRLHMRSNGDVVRKFFVGNIWDVYKMVGGVAGR